MVIIYIFAAIPLAIGLCLAKRSKCFRKHPCPEEPLPEEIEAEMEAEMEAEKLQKTLDQTLDQTLDKTLEQVRQDQIAYQKEARRAKKESKAFSTN